MAAWARRMSSSELVVRVVLTRSLSRVCVLLSVIVAFVATTFTFLPSPLYAQSVISGTVDARVEPGYGRLIFRFDRMPGHVVTSNAGVIVIAFDEPVDVNLEGVDIALSDYFTVGRLDPDGRAARFALKQVLRVNTTAAGDRLFVDLLPRTWSGPSPELPFDIVEQLAREAEEAERIAREKLEREARLKESLPVTLRVGENPTFTRLFFDWGADTNVKAGFSRSEDAGTITFDRFGKLDTGPFNVDLPNLVSAITSKNGEDGLIVYLKLTSEDHSVRAFPEDGGFIVDISDPSRGAAVGVSNALLPGAGRDRTITQIEDSRTEDLDELLPQSTPSDPAVRPSVTTETSDLAEVLSTQTDFDIAAAEAAQREQIESTDSTLTIQDLDGNVLSEEAPRSPEQDSSSSIIDYPVINAKAVEAETTLDLIFPFVQETPAAIFSRAGVVWAFFDTTKEIDLRDVRRAAGKRFTEVTTARTPWGPVLRFVLSKPQLISATLVDNAWSIRFGGITDANLSRIPIRRSPRGLDDLVISADLPDASEVHWVKDPIVGDRIAVVPALGPVRAIVKPREFVDFSALQTAHGLAVIPKTDQVMVDTIGSQVVINQPGGLSLSQGDNQRPAIRGAEQLSLSNTSFINFNEWSHGDGTLLREQIGVLERASAEASEAEQTAARLALARLYLAHGFAQEARGLIRLAAQNEPKIIVEPAFRALEAIANIMSGNYDIARKDLSDPDLRDEPETKLWLGFADAMEGDWSKAQTRISPNEEVIRSYPPTLQKQFRLLAARAAIETRDVANAQFHMNVLANTPLTNTEEARRLVLLGRLLDMEGEPEEAVEAYDKAIASTVRPAEAEALVRKARVGLRDETIDPNEAINILERVAISWRGDEIELMALSSLADSYVAAGSYRRAFELMESASFGHADNANTRDFQDKMSEVFKDLYLRGGADAMPPVEALALYNDFKELTPIGRDGDEMIRRLAERLIDVDLLSPAEELLAHQVTNRLRGAARAQVAGTLAFVQLMNDRPAQALQTLRRTRQAVLPQALRYQRLILEARALAETGRPDLAVELLKSVEGPDTARLQADILWRAERWQSAGEQLERLLGTSWDGDGALDQEQRIDVLRAAIAYSLAGDDLGLDRLGRKFTAKMAESEDGAAFSVVTRPISQKGIEFKRLVNDLANTDTLERFLEQYRSQYGNQPIVDQPAPESS